MIVSLTGAQLHFERLLADQISLFGKEALRDKQTCTLQSAIENERLYTRNDRINVERQMKDAIAESGYQQNEDVWFA